MAEPFKNLIDAKVVRAAAGHLQRVHPAFPRQDFEARALHGLQALELKARALHVCDALAHTLPADFAEAADVIERALAPPIPVDAPSAVRHDEDGLAGWIVWPIGEWAARHGHGDVPRALRLLRELTCRFTAEWAIRPFIERHPDVTFAQLAAWCDDDDAHVRRLVSEGSRPRLPWGARLSALIADPSPTLPLLLRLRDDRSPYVRRSVANHLNDIARDHPDDAAALIADWLKDAPEPRRAMLRHASRTLLKQGHPQALASWGVHGAFEGKLALKLSPRRIVLGDSVDIEVTLRSTATDTQTLMVDYAIHFARARGATGRKVFKGWKLTLAPGERRTLTRAHAIRDVTVRRHYAGAHRVELLVNGQPAAESRFTLALPAD